MKEITPHACWLRLLHSIHCMFAVFTFIGFLVIQPEWISELTTSLWGQSSPSIVSSSSVESSDQGQEQEQGKDDTLPVLLHIPIPVAPNHFTAGAAWVLAVAFVGIFSFIIVITNVFSQLPTNLLSVFHYVATVIIFLGSWIGLLDRRVEIAFISPHILLFTISYIHALLHAATFIVNIAISDGVVSHSISYASLASVSDYLPPSFSKRFARIRPTTETTT